MVKFFCLIKVNLQSLRALRLRGDYFRIELKGLGKSDGDAGMSIGPLCGLALL